MWINSSIANILQMSFEPDNINDKNIHAAVCQIMLKIGY